jgi:transposase InsO family protein
MSSNGAFHQQTDRKKWGHPLKGPLGGQKESFKTISGSVLGLFYCYYSWLPWSDPKWPFSLKTEWIADIIYRTRDEARSDVIRYIEVFYNSHRLHSFLEYKNPNVFENNFSLAKVL